MLQEVIEKRTYQIPFQGPLVGSSQRRRGLFDVLLRKEDARVICVGAEKDRSFFHPFYLKSDPDSLGSLMGQLATSKTIIMLCSIPFTTEEKRQLSQIFKKRKRPFSTHF